MADKYTRSDRISDLYKGEAYSGRGRDSLSRQRLDVLKRELQKENPGERIKDDEEVRDSESMKRIGFPPVRGGGLPE
jgi:hypothetical protein